MVGVLGGFTTFSSYAYETFVMLRDAQFLHAALSAGGQVFLGLALSVGVPAGAIVVGGAGEAVKRTRDASRHSVAAASRQQDGGCHQISAAS
jgi:hypothetical protein